MPEMLLEDMATRARAALWDDVSNDMRAIPLFTNHIDDFSGVVSNALTQFDN